MLAGIPKGEHDFVGTCAALELGSEHALLLACVRDALFVSAAVIHLAILQSGLGIELSRIVWYSLVLLKRTISMAGSVRRRAHSHWVLSANANLIRFGGSRLVCEKT